MSLSKNNSTRQSTKSSKSARQRNAQQTAEFPSGLISVKYGTLAFLPYRSDCTRIGLFWLQTRIQYLQILYNTIHYRY